MASVRASQKPNPATLVVFPIAPSRRDETALFFDEFYQTCYALYTNCVLFALALLSSGDPDVAPLLVLLSAINDATAMPKVGHGLRGEVLAFTGTSYGTAETVGFLLAQGCLDGWVGCEDGWVEELVRGLEGTMGDGCDGAYGKDEVLRIEEDGEIVWAAWNMLLNEFLRGDGGLTMA